MTLPIRHISNTSPPKFEWYQVVTLPGGGLQVLHHEGFVQSSMESALVDLIRIANQFYKDNQILRDIKR